MQQFYLQYGKRFMDVVLVIFIAVIFSWIMILIVLGYAITFQFPILFRHARIGKDRKIFTLFKFRTLSGDETLSLHERRFPLGNLLRITNLDELPQLWNVLKGEMSLVGPRPLPVAYDSLFSLEQQLRHQVLPGITGLAQVSGKNGIGWPDKFRYDMEYVKQVSFRLDCIILFKTLILALSFKRDISLDEEKFTG